MGRINGAILMAACFGAGLGIPWLTHRSDAALRGPERSEDRAHADRGLEFEKLWREHGATLTASRDEVLRDPGLLKTEQGRRRIIDLLIIDPEAINAIAAMASPEERNQCIGELFNQMRKDCPSGLFPVLMKVRFDLSGVPELTGCFYVAIDQSPADAWTALETLKSKLSSEQIHGFEGACCYSPESRRALLAQAAAGNKDLPDEISSLAAMMELESGAELGAEVRSIPGADDLVKSFEDRKLIKGWLDGSEILAAAQLRELSPAAVSKAVMDRLERGDGLSAEQFRMLGEAGQADEQIEVLGMLPTFGRSADAAPLVEALLQGNASAETKDTALREAAQGLLIQGGDVSSAIGLINRMNSNEEFAKSIGETLEAWAAGDPAGAEEYASQLNDPALKAKVLEAARKATIRPGP